MEKEKVRAVVYASTRRSRMREGRGFSLREIRSAGLTVQETKRLGILVDKRRKTSHLTNVQTLKEYCGIVIPLTEIKGIGKAIERKLAEAAISDIYDLAHADLNSLAKQVSQSKKSLQRWQDDAKKLLEQ